MLPNFLIIGGQRCATGWIAQCLREHPDVFMAPDETRFFDQNFSNGSVWWDREYFSSYCNQKAVGEKTANYLTDENTPQLIWQTLPDVKIICCIRDPAERLYSGMMMKRNLAPELCDLTFDELIERESDLIERGRYSYYLKHYFDLFPNKNILILLYQDKLNDPRGFMQRIYRFVGVNEAFVPRSLKVQIKPGATENSSPLLSRLSRILTHRASPFRWLYSRLRKSNHFKYISSENIRKLDDIYYDEITRLEVLLKEDLSVWRSHG
jgi:hypothetical protein